MSVSIGPFLICILCIAFLTGYLYMILYLLDQPYIYGAKAVFIGIAFILLRMCIPVNFPFTYTIYSKKILLPLAEIFFVSIGNSDYMFSDILMMLWLSIAAIKLGRLCVRSFLLRQYLDAYTVTDDSQYSKLFASIRKYSPKPIRVAVIPYDISPAVSGIFRPTIIFPEYFDVFSADELDYICIHKINHYKRRDLWMKWILEVLSCIHWWNPLIYIMKREYALALELTNDHLLIQEHPCYNCIDYSNLILTIAESKDAVPHRYSDKLTSFVRKNHSDLKVRLSFLLREPKETKKKKGMLWIHTVIICIAVVISLFIVTDPTFRTYSTTEDQEFEMDISNTYLIHTSKGYDIYIDEKYTGTITELPNELQNYKIYEQGDFTK